MTQTLTALFDSHADAERGRSRLAQIGIPPNEIRIMDQATASSGKPSTEAHDLWDSVKQLIMPEPDRYEYEEGIRRGGSLLTAPVDEALADRTAATLQECHPIDINQRTAEWRAAGWQGREEVIPVAEEKLRVGKRQVERGGIRVRAYPVEQSVQENVRLREEHVDVERRPASTASSSVAPGELLKERTVEMRETGEEPVVQKETRVKEEVVARKRAEEREQPVQGKVRHTEVDIENASDKAGSRTSGAVQPKENRPPRH